MLESKGTMTKDMRDACDLFDFVTERNRTEHEINSFLCSLAHCKYPYSKTLEGHNLRKKYKNWLRFQMKKMLKLYEQKKNSAPNPLNNSKE